MGVRGADPGHMFTPKLKVEITEKIDNLLFTLKMASAEVVETSVTNNNPSQDSNHPDDLFQSN